MPIRAHVDVATQTLRAKRTETFFWLSLAALVAAFLAWQAATMDLQSWDRDEGIALMLAQSERDGHRLHRDFFSDVSPLFVASIRIGLDILGTTLAAGRWVILIYAALALFATGWLTALIAGRWAGLAAVVLLGLSPGFRSASRVIWADLPSSGFATLAIALVLQYGRRRSRRWLILAGLAMGASLLVKPLSVAMLVPLVMALWVERVHEDRPFRLLQPLTLLAAATALLPLAALAYYGPHLLSDLLMFSWKAQQAMQVDVLKHLEQVGFYLCRDPGLLALVLPCHLSADNGPRVLTHMGHGFSPKVVQWAFTQSGPRVT